MKIVNIHHRFGILVMISPYSCWLKRGKKSKGMIKNQFCRKLIFFDLIKFIVIKQIAGRAGRARSEYPNGEVTTLLNDDVEYLEYCMKSDLKPVQTLGIFPSADQIEFFSQDLMQKVNGRFLQDYYF